MNTGNSITRRQVIKTIGAGAALTGLGLFSVNTGLAAPSAVSPLAQPFSLPPLDYGFDALEPHIDRRTMEIHHDKHHQGYVNNANNALAKYPALQNKTAEQLLNRLDEVPDPIRSAVKNNVGGHANHSLFWKIIGPNGGGEPRGACAAAIKAEFGSVTDFQTQFSQAALKCFGSGWAWLSLRDGKLLIHSTANQDSPLSEGLTPLVGLDVWEHAYYLNYQNRRADYVQAFWSVINWRQVEANYAAAG
ncbi:MAG: superoxide dismutase [Cephaloticoccus sp.]|nr:superoxide dismutase [Cephaloticoccus sp.]MCF7760375.1 superoxide dismutase [Cephaloticoccus sp.]